MLVTLFMSAFFGVGGVIAGSCEAPEVENGEVSGKGDANSWTGTFSCKNGFALVGDRRLKCRKGAWSSAPPLCAGGNCDSSLIPQVEHARLHSYQPLKYRGSVFAYKCNPGFKKVGPGKIVCGGKSWGLGEPTVCAKQGCDETSVNAIPFGHAERKADGAVFSFRCEEGGILEGSPLLFCNGTRWNGSAPQCMRAVLTPSLTLEPGEGPFKVSQAVSVVCVGQEVEPPSTISLELVKENSSTLVLGLSSDGHLSLDISEYLVPSMHGAELRCIASNGDGSSKQTKQAQLKLDILHGPERVSLTGPESGPPGTKVEFKCSSSPSNPAAKLKWEGERDTVTFIRSPLIQQPRIEVGESNEVWTGTGWETHSSAKVTIPEGNPTSFLVRCTAENQRIDHDIETAKLFKIHYPPHRVTVEGPKKVAQGEMVSLQCKSDPALPPASLQWTIRRNGEEEVLETDELSYQGAFAYGGGPNVGAAMISDLSFSAGPPGKLEVECYAEHETLDENRKTFSHVIEILDSEAVKAKRGETVKEEETSDEQKSNRDMNEPKEGEVKSASTSQGSRLDQSLKLIILPLCWTLLLSFKVQTF